MSTQFGKKIENLKRFHKLIKDNKSIKMLIDLLQSLSPLFLGTTSQDLCVRKELELVSEELEKLKLDDIEETFKELAVLPEITAIIIKSSKSYTLALLMIPQGKYFGWHDHNNMNGISRIVSGELKIRSMNPEHLKHFSESTYLYPVDRLRQQTLKSDTQLLSIIYPDSFNIHEITGVKQSCFLDLLIPQYPESCHYFETCDQPIVQGELEDKIKIRRIEESYEQIIGLEKLVKSWKEQDNSSKNSINISSNKSIS